jgi:hypothetical protein
MPNTELYQLTPWRERVYVTVAEAAVILARSPSWVRDQITSRTLDTVELPSSGPTVVTVQSVLRMIALAKRPEAWTPPYANLKRSIPRLKLVVDNDKK